MANKGRYAPSGSGSVGYRDYVQMKDAPFLQNVVVYAAERELREECAISREIRLDTVVIWYARLLERGGKPDFIRLTFVAATVDQVKDGFDKHMRLSEAGLVDSVELVTVADGELLSAALCGEMGRLREEGNRISIQLQLCADCLRRIESTAEGARWIAEHRACW